MKFTAEYLRTILDYDGETGFFTWKARILCDNATSRKWSSRWAGKQAGSIRRQGYKFITINWVHYKASRLAWLWVRGNWPNSLIDHINCNKADDRFCNLREATPSQNNMNKGMRASNTSGFKGVSKWRRKWMACIRVHGKTKYLGLFVSPQEAHAAYCRAAKELHGEFARAA